jgi:hypothetical protein
MAAVSTPPVVNYNMGVLLYQRGRTAEAERYLNAAIAADQRMQPARDILAQIHPAAPEYRTARLSTPVATTPTVTISPPVDIAPQRTTATVVEEPVTPTPEGPAPELPQIIDTGAQMPDALEMTPTLLPPVN